MTSHIRELITDEIFQRTDLLREALKNNKPSLKSSPERIQRINKYLDCVSETLRKYNTSLFPDQIEYYKSLCEAILDEDVKIVVTKHSIRMETNRKFEFSPAYKFAAVLIEDEIYLITEVQEDDFIGFNKFGSYKAFQISEARFIFSSNISLHSDHINNFLVDYKESNYIDEPKINLDKIFGI
jgi:hypothetical protein